MPLLNSVTLTRSRRPNAGSRMSRLLNEEEEDDFYQSAYGGFAEEENDNDYESESSGQDSIDTDFVDTEEEDEEDGSANDVLDEEKRKRRSRRVITKSYKEPKAKKEANEKPKTEPRSRNRAAASGSENNDNSAEAVEARRLRASTIRATETALQRRRQQGANSEVTAVKRKAFLAEIAQRKNVPEVRRLTQEELLAEAKITEEINKRSLARYQRMEIERKKIRVQKTVSQQPMIRTHSFTVPSLSEQPEVYDVTVNSENDVEMRKMLVDQSAKCARTLVSFADEATFAAAFPSMVPAAGSKSSAPGRKKRVKHCPITGKVARYMDPLTRTPYADLAAFRALRHLYRIHLETGTSATELLRRLRAGELRIGGSTEDGMPEDNC
ncbi:hypothetical protein ACTXT7_013054 [Hymenolepis weldensis]